MNPSRTKTNLPIGPLVAAIGAALLIVSLFLDWYEPDIEGFTVYEFLDLLLVLMALAIIASLAGGMGVLRAAPSPGVSLAVALFTIFVVLSQILNDPPAVANGNAGKDVGIWLALAGAALMVAGSVLAYSRISLAFEARTDTPSPGPDEAQTVDERAASAAQEDPTPPPGEPDARPPSRRPRRPSPSRAAAPHPKTRRRLASHVSVAVRDEPRRGAATQQDTPYLDALRAYAARDPGRFHVPGHKGGTAADPASRRCIGRGGAGAGHSRAHLRGGHGHRARPLLRVPAPGGRGVGGQRTWFLVNGASQGNHVALLALAHLGKEVVTQRNAHSSTIDALVLSGLRPTFIAPELDPELHIAHCMTPESLERALEATPGAVGATVVSPTYFGAMADVAALVEVAHARGVPLIVDEAWGAHLAFHPDLPASALSLGADLVDSSIHKIVGSLTQSALIHLGHSSLIELEVVDRCVTLLESTSPNSYLYASLDSARRAAAVHGEELLSETLSALRATRRAVRAIPDLDVLDERLARAGSVRLRPAAPGHRRTRHRVQRLRPGAQAARGARRADGARGRERDGRGIRDERGRDRRRRAPGHRPAARGRGRERRPAPRGRGAVRAAAPVGRAAMTPREAFLGPQEVVPARDAIGRVAAESLAAYPPGIPNVLPGERLTAETLDYVQQALDHGGALRGASDRKLRTLRVAIEPG